MHAIRKTPFPPFSPLIPVPVNATPNPAIIDAVCLSELIILSNSTPIHGPILPGWTHSLTHSPIPSHYIQPRTRTRATLYIYQRHGAAHRTQGGKESLCGQEGDGGSTLPHTAEIAA